MRTKTDLKSYLVMSVFLLGMVCTTLAGQTITVDDDGPAYFNNIQAAINAATHGDTVIVADGTYKGLGNRDIDFLGKAITVRSLNGPETCIINCEGTESDSHRGFYFHSGEGPDSVLSGLTITNGYAPKEQIGKYIRMHGGAIYCDYSSPVITNCIFRENISGWKGGAIMSRGSKPKIINCLFQNNVAQGGGGLHTSAVYGSSQGPIMTNCTFVDNFANNRFGGGGVYCDSTGKTTLTNCILWGNTFQGGGGYIAQVKLPNPVISCCCIASVPLLAPDGYHLSAGSPCINAGDPTGGYSRQTDIDGEPRVMGGRVDIGADEYKPGMLVGLEIVGPGEVAENFSASYKAVLHFDNDSTRDVTALAEWSVEPNTYATFEENGMLTTKDIVTHQSAIILASYSEGDVTVEAEKPIDIFPICPTGTALQFDGVDDYVDCGNDASLDLGSGSFTLAAWVKTSVTNELYDRIISHYCGGHPGHYQTVFLDFDGNHHAQVCMRDNALNLAKVTGTTNIEDGNWHCVVGVRDEDTLYLYVDGVCEGMPADASDVGDVVGPEPWTIGAAKDYRGILYTHYNGLIDEVAIYNRALSAEEIQANMHRRLAGDEPGLIGYWDFDEGEGQIVYDLSGNGNDGQLGSTPEADVSDPAWVESDAPIGVCSLYQIATLATDGAVECKTALLEELLAALAEEWTAYEALEELLESGDYGDLNYGDIVTAKQKIHSATQHEEQSISALEKSVEKLKDALSALGYELKPPSSIKRLLDLLGLEWTEPVAVMEVNTDFAEEWTPFLSFDGLTLYFARVHSDTFYDGRIFEATRQEPFGPFTSVSEISGTLNSSSGHVLSPWVSPDNLRMYYYTESSVGWELKVTERASDNAPWPIGTNITELNVLGTRHQTPRLTANELTIFFSSRNMPGGYGGYDIWMATRPDRNSPFGTVRNLAEINTVSSDHAPFVSPDGLMLYFDSDRNVKYQLFRATRGSLNEPFGNIEHLSLFDTPEGISIHPCVSSDGTAIYFVRVVEGQHNIWVSYRIEDPYELAVIHIEDAIAKKVKALERISAELEKEWAAYEALEELLESGDYGDLDKGDIVTAKQKIHSAIQHEEQAIDALEKSIEKLEDALSALGYEPPPPPPPPGQASNPNPANGATGVSTNADLSWTAGSNAVSHDVYFGTTSPGAFQSNQTATTFDPGTMAPNTTYYWRIDEVNPSGTTTSTVWSFRTIGGGGPPI